MTGGSPSSTGEGRGKTATQEGDGWGIQRSCLLLIYFREAKPVVVMDIHLRGSMARARYVLWKPVTTHAYGAGFGTEYLLR